MTIDKFCGYCSAFRNPDTFVAIEKIRNGQRYIIQRCAECDRRRKVDTAKTRVEFGKETTRKNKDSASAALRKAWAEKQTDKEQ